jgi:hypothetical protein
MYVSLSYPTPPVSISVDTRFANQPRKLQNWFLCGTSVKGLEIIIWRDGRLTAHSFNGHYTTARDYGVPVNYAYNTWVVLNSQLSIRFGPKNRIYTNYGYQTLESILRTILTQNNKFMTKYQNQVDLLPKSFLCKLE